VQFYYLSRKLDNIARYAPIWQHWLKHKNTHATSHFSLTMTLSCQVKAINIYFHHWFTQLKEFASHEILYFVIIIEKTIDSKESNDVINSIKCTPDHFRILKLRLTKNYVCDNYLDTPHIWVGLGTWCHVSRWRYRRICL
jgi:hypothetical protein